MEYIKIFESFNRETNLLPKEEQIKVDTILNIVYELLEDEGYQYTEEENDTPNTFTYLKNKDFKRETDWVLKRRLYQGIVFNTVFGKFRFVVLLKKNVNEIASYTLYVPYIDNPEKPVEDHDIAIKTKNLNDLFKQLFRIFREYPSIIEFRKLCNKLHNNVTENKETSFVIFLTDKNKILCKLLYDRKLYFGFDKDEVYVSEWDTSNGPYDVFEGIAIINHGLPKGVIDFIKQTKGNLKHRLEQIKPELENILHKYRGAIKMKKFGF